MKKSAYLSDLAFAFAATFLPALCYLRFRNVPLGWATLVAVLLAIGVCIAVGSLFQKKYHKETLKARERREAEMLTLDLALLSPKDACAWVLERWNDLLENEPVGASLVKYRGVWLIVGESHVAGCRFSGAPIQAESLLGLLAYPTEKECVMLCSDLDPSAKELAERFSLRTMRGEELYLRLKKSNRLPATYKSAVAFDKKKKRRGQLWFQKRNAKPFLTGGALTLISSLFSPFPYYYLVMGIALVSLSAVLRFWGT